MILCWRNILWRRNGIAGTMGVLVDCSNLDGPTISKKFKTKKIGSRATHEIEWKKDKVYVYESSDMTEPEEISLQRLNSYKKKKLNTIVVEKYISPKPSLLVQEAETAPINSNLTTHKVDTIETALAQSGIVSASESSSLSVQALVPSPPSLNVRWAEYPGNDLHRLSKQCLEKLKELYDIGKNNKKRKVGAERAHQILIDTILLKNWDQQLDVTVPKIKAFFAMTPTKQKNTIDQLLIDTEDVKEATEDLLENERNAQALSLVDVDLESTIEKLNTFNIS